MRRYSIRSLTSGGGSVVVNSKGKVRRKPIMLTLTIFVLISIVIEPSCENPTTATARRAPRQIGQFNQTSTTRTFFESSRSHQRKNQTATRTTTSRMDKIDLTPAKRSSAAMHTREISKKRFKSSTNVTNEPVSLFSNSNEIDLNNNTISLDDDSRRGQQRHRPRQNVVDSVNGTVDLSQYQQTDVDRLYGDALLVYFKNFNE